jgi:hypothetical protein
MNDFNNLVKLVLNEVSLGAYMQVAKDATRSAAKAATSPLSVAKGALKAADFFASKSGMEYNGQFGTLANKIQTLQDLGATAQEELILKKLYGENPKKGDKINIELPGIQAPNAYIKDIKPGTKDDSIYTVELFPIGLTSAQKAIQAVKDKSPVDELSFTKVNKDYGSTNVTLSFYKNKKLVAARNIPGLKDSGGLHFNGDSQPWTINLDSSDSIDFTDIAAMVANDKSLGLDDKQIAQVSATTNYPQLKQVLTKFGKGDLYIKTYTNAVTALRQGKTPPTTPTTSGNTETASSPVEQQTTGINARTPEGNPVAGQTRFTTADKKKIYLYGKNGWRQYDSNTKKWGSPVQQQVQITTAWQKSQNITPTVKPATSNEKPAVQSKRATRGQTTTKTGTPVDQPTSADVASMNLPSHPLHSRSPVNRRK